jgi:MFS family permease
MSNKIFYGWWIVFACFLIACYVGSVVFFGLTAFIEPIREEFGWSYAQISFAASLRGLEMGLFAPFIGFLVDRFGSRKLIFYGVIAVGLGLMLLSRTQSLAMFYGCFVLIGFGAGGCTSVVTMTVVANWFHRKVGIALGVMSSGLGASGLLVPLIARMIDVSGWRSTLIILGLGMWAIGVPLSFVIREKPEQYGYQPDGEPLKMPVPTLEFQAKAVEMDVKRALKTRAFLYLSLAETVRMMAVAAVVVHIMPYLKSLGMQRSAAAFVAGAIPVFSIMGRFGFGWLGDILDKRYVTAAVYIFMALGMLAFCYGQVQWIIYLFVLLFPPGFGGSMVLRGAILREYFGRDSFGKILGIVMGIVSIGGIIGPTLAGWVFDSLGSYHLIWLLFCGLLSLSVGLILRIR